ncbi:MAG: hypothetical protein EOP88_07760 [Verrucomicrobiaceae bacterium]|nr:MAG: hypothetical protein EOP88_07760 [Verrucomicrobiaceae bacterium]
MTPKQAVRWEKHRDDGKEWYVLLWGIFAYGVPMVAFWTLYFRYTAPEMGLPRAILTNMAIHLTCGFFLGILMWGSGERKYLKYRAGLKKADARQTTTSES